MPKERLNMPNMDDIRKNPNKYKDGNNDFLDADPEQSKLEEEQEAKDLDDLFGSDDEDDVNLMGGDLGLGDLEGLNLLLDPSFLGKIQEMVQDLNGSMRNLNKNKEMLKKFKNEIDVYKNKRNKCREMYRKKKNELRDAEETKKNLKQQLIDMENDKAGLENTIKKEEDAYMKGNQRDLKKRRSKLDTEIIDLEAIIQNEKPLLAELANKKRQESDILERIKELKKRIAQQVNLQDQLNGGILEEKQSIKVNNKDMTVARFRIRGFSKSMAVKQENLKLRDLVDDVKSKSMNITEELDRIYQDKTLSEEELQMIMEEMREFGDLDLDLSYKNDHEKFSALKETLEELKKKALTMDFKGIEKDIDRLRVKIKENQKIERNCKGSITRSNQKIEGYGASIQRSEKKLIVLRAELAQLEEQLSKCRNYINTKTMELKNAKEMRDQKKGELREINNDLQKLQNAHVKQNNALRGEKAQKLKGINNLRDGLQKNKDSLRKNKKRLNRIASECNLYHKYAEDLKKKAMKIKKKFPMHKKVIGKLKKDIRMQLKSLSGLAM